MGYYRRTHQLRIIAGKAKHLLLLAPIGSKTRPTSDRIKETLFNMIQYELEDIIFIDLYAGSGGIGLEAISRGAKQGYFVENEKEAIACIQENIKSTKLEDSCVLIKNDVLTAIQNQLPTLVKEPAGVIFMDPPYESDIEREVLLALKKQTFINKDTLIIIEANKQKSFDFVFEIGFTIIKEKLYKTNKHVFLHATEV